MTNQYKIFSLTIFFVGLSAENAYSDTAFEVIDPIKNHLSFGLAHEYSDNIYSLQSNEQSGYEDIMKASVGYQVERPTNKLSLNYRGNRSKYSVNDLGNNNFWAGSAQALQQLGSENIVMDLRHLRHRYLLDEGGPAQPNNQGNRDILSATPMLRFPYTKRARFELSHSVKRIKFTDEPDQNTNREITNLNWVNAVNSKLSFQLLGEVGTSKFPEYGIDYDQKKASINLKGLLNNGEYSFAGGHSQVELQGTIEKGTNYNISMLYNIGKSAFNISAQRELTDSSVGLEIGESETGDFNFSLTQLLWRERVDLTYLLTARNNLFMNTTTVFWNKESPLFKLGETNEDTNLEEIEQSGISNSSRWRLSNKINVSMALSYRDSDLYGGDNKQQWRIDSSMRYKLNDKLSFQLKARYTDEKNNQRRTQFDEMRFSAELEFRYK